MKVYLDTSVLLKLYHQESGSDNIELLLKSGKINTIYLSELSKVEFFSAIWKKVRTNEIALYNALITLKHFEPDFPKYAFIPTDSLIIEQAKAFLLKYGETGLRTLDSIQLSTVVYLKKIADQFFTADKLLNSFFKEEYLKVSQS